jgi:hypothetical protein
MHFRKSIFIVIFLLFSHAALAKDSSSEPSKGTQKGGAMDFLTRIFPHPMVTVSYGSIDWQVKYPSGISYATGQYLQGSFDFTVWFFHFVLGYNYATGRGKTNYDYTDEITSLHYTFDNTKSKNTFAGPYAGIRIVPYESHMLHPYFEVGGNAGVLNIRYPDAESASTYTLDRLAKFNETQVYAGLYGEAGLEFRFFNNLVLAGGTRMMQVNSTRVETLAKSKISMVGTSLFGTIGVRY